MRSKVGEIIREVWQWKYRKRRGTSLSVSYEKPRRAAHLKGYHHTSHKKEIEDGTGGGREKWGSRLGGVGKNI